MVIWHFSWFLMRFSWFFFANNPQKLFSYNNNSSKNKYKNVKEQLHMNLQCSLCTYEKAGNHSRKIAIVKSDD